MTAFNWTVSKLVAQLARRPGDEVIYSFHRADGSVAKSTVNILVQRILAVMTKARSCNEEQPVVALFMENSAEFPAILLGLMAAGAVTVPINPNTNPADVRYIVTSSGVKYIIAGTSSPTFAIDSLGPGVEISTAESWVEGGPGTLNIADMPDIAGTQPSLIIHTSGTTSKPKGAVLPQGSLLDNGQLIANHFNFSRSNQLTTLPLYHVHALTFGLFSSLTTGGQLHVLESFKPQQWRELVTREKIDWTSIVPSLLPLLRMTGVSREVAPTLKGVFVSSAPLNEKAAGLFEKHSGIPLIQAYGMTECTCWATCCTLQHWRDEFQDQCRSIGHALPGVDMKILGPDDEELGEGATGEIVIGGKYLMLEYLNLPAVTAATLSTRGLRSGDLGFYKLIHGTRYYFIAGRNKEVIIKNADKFSPSAIEDEIYQSFPDVAGYVAIVGYPHDLTGEDIGLCIDTRLFAATTTNKDSFTAFIQAMHASIRPSVVILKNSPIEKTFTGKIQRAKMRDLFSPFSKFMGGPQFVDAPD
jgi:long-chain acyl-CoA synthetase